MRRLLVWLLLMVSAASHAKDFTLQEIRDELLGKEVIVLGNEFPSAKLPPGLERLRWNRSLTMCGPAGP